MENLHPSRTQFSLAKRSTWHARARGSRSRSFPSFYRGITFFSSMYALLFLFVGAGDKKIISSLVFLLLEITFLVVDQIRLACPDPFLPSFVLMS
jgi:hypothetical protein